MSAGDNLRALHAQQLGALADLARDTAEMKKVIASIGGKVDGIYDNTTSLIAMGMHTQAMVEALRVAMEALAKDTPAARKDALLAALKDGKARLKVSYACSVFAHDAAC